MSQPDPTHAAIRAEAKRTALIDAAEWLESQGADFVVGKVTDEGLYDAATAAVGAVMDALAAALRRRAQSEE